LHVVDFHPEFEDHIASVNQTLMDIKASDNRLFNKIDAYTHLTIDEDDLMTEKHQDTIHFKSGSPLDGRVGEENAIRQQTKKI
jgi:GTP-binding protein HflX